MGGNSGQTFQCAGLSHAESGIGCCSVAAGKISHSDLFILLRGLLLQGNRRNSGDERNHRTDPAVQSEEKAEGNPVKELSGEKNVR